MNATQVRADAVRLLRENFGQILALMIPIWIAWVGATYLVSTIIGGAIGAIISAVIALLGLGCAEAAIVIYFRQRMEGISPVVGNVLRAAAPQSAKLGILILIKYIYIALGCLLLIFPGVVVATRMLIAEQIFLLRDAKILNSIDSSIDLTKPYFGLIVRSVGVLYAVAFAIRFGIDLIAGSINQYLPLLLYPISATIFSVTTIAAFQVYSHVEGERGTGA